MPAAARKDAVPSHSHAFGTSLVDWQKRWPGSSGSANPFGKPICGERVGRAFFLNVAVQPGTTEFDCHLKPGTRLLATPGGALNDMGYAAVAQAFEDATASPCGS